MRLMWIILAVLAGIAAGGCGSKTAPMADDSSAERPGESPAPAELEVTVQGLRNSQGIVLCTLFDHGAGFPSDAAKAARKARIELPAKDGVRFLFEDLEPGSWAVSVVHDENGNGTLDRNFLGIPSEGYGVSNNPPMGLGPPSFESARLELEAGDRSISITMQYH